MTQPASTATRQAENNLSKSSESKPLSKQEKLLYSYIVACLLESGNLDDNKAGIVALAKQARASSAMLKILVNKARSEHSEIDLIARITKSIAAHKQSKKEFSDDIFERLLQAAEQAGKDEIWLSKKSGYSPSHSCAQAEATKGKKPLFGRFKPLSRPKIG